MTIATRAKQALRQGAQWEKRTIGMSSFVPLALRRRMKRAIRKSLLPEGRRFFSGRLEDLFRRLDERGACYVVVRWFEDLPHRVDGDIDFLVADDSLDDFETVLDRNRVGFPCDVYSESAVEGYRYGNLSYYPPELARRILDRRISHDASVSVPCTEDHFFSLAYHCLYHKGPDCGLPTSTSGVRPVRAPNHDYRARLEGLAAELGLSVDMNMEALDALLNEHGWRPAHHVLDRLATENAWLRARLLAERP